MLRNLIKSRQYMYRKDRILSPMKCVGERGSGNFEKITRDEAFAITAEKLFGERIGLRRCPKPE